MLRSSSLPLALCLLAAPAAAIQIDSDFYFDEDTPTPAFVLALQTCDADERTPAHRKPFAGGFIFLVKCASNNENFVETLIFAWSEQGDGARLLLFPGPGKRREGFEEVLSNIRWYPDTNEIGEIAVDSDPDSRPTPNVCRSEGRWRLEGEKREPKLVFWRETSDCEGNTGWVMVVGTG